MSKNKQPKRYFRFGRNQAEGLCVSLILDKQWKSQASLLIMQHSKYDNFKERQDNRVTWMKSLKVNFNGFIKALKFLYYNEIVMTKENILLIRIKEIMIITILRVSSAQMAQELSLVQYLPLIDRYVYTTVCIYY